MFKGFENIDPCMFFRVNSAPTRGHCLKLIKPRCHLDIRKYSFAQRIVDIWNSIDDSIVNQFNGKINMYCMVEGSYNLLNQASFPHKYYTTILLLQKTEELKCAAVRWSRAAYAASGAHYYLRCIRNATIKLPLLYFCPMILQIIGQVLISCFSSQEPAGPVKDGTLGTLVYSASQCLQLPSQSSSTVAHCILVITHFTDPERTEARECRV